MLKLTYSRFWLKTSDLQYKFYENLTGSQILGAPNGYLRV